MKPFRLTNLDIVFIAIALGFSLMNLAAFTYMAGERGAFERSSTVFIGFGSLIVINAVTAVSFLIRRPILLLIISLLSIVLIAIVLLVFSELMVTICIPYQLYTIARSFRLFQ